MSFGFLREGEQGQSRSHPTQKPITLIEDIITQWCDGEIIADPFLGSGSTLIACERLGRRCYGVEIEPRYVDVAVRRWEEYTGKKAVLDGRL
jgi:DNA modification methylase